MAASQTNIPTSNDDYQIIGWIFAAQDLASDVVTNAQKVVASATTSIAASTQKITTTVSTGAAKVVEQAATMMTGVAREAAGPLKFVLGSFAAVFGDLQSTLGSVVDAADDAFMRLVAGAKRGGAAVGAAVSRGFDRVVGGMIAVGDAVLNTELSFRDLGTAATAVARVVAGALPRAFDVFKSATAIATTSVGDLVQKFIDLDNIRGVIKATGGVFGALLGPFGKLLNLFEPLIDLLVEGLGPAFRTFSQTVGQAFTPFFETMNAVMETIAPLIREALVPLNEILQTVAIQFGAFIINFVKSGAVTDALAKIVRELLPVVLDLAPALFDVAKALAEAAVELLPLVPELVKLAAVLVKEILAPVTIAGLRLMIDLFKELVPVIRDWLPVVTDVMKQATDQVREFLKLFTGVKDVIEQIAGVGPGSEEEAAQAAQGAGFSQVTNEMRAREQAARRKAGFADGGVIMPQPGGLDAILGEGGKPEIVMPLTPEAVRTVMQPVAAQLNLNAPWASQAKEAVGLMREIRNLLRGTLTVAAEESRADPVAVGMTGLVGA